MYLVRMDVLDDRAGLTYRALRAPKQEWLMAVYEKAIELGPGGTKVKFSG